MKKFLTLAVVLWATTTVFAQAPRPGAPYQRPVVKPPGEVATLAGIDLVGTPGPGSNLVAIVHVTLDPGWGIYSSAPMDRNVMAAYTRFTIPPGVTVLPVAYPTPRRQPIPGTTQPRLVYEDGFDLKIPITMNNYVALPATMPGVLNYQAVGKGPAEMPPRQLNFTITFPKPAATAATPAPPRYR